MNLRPPWLRVLILLLWISALPSLAYSQQADSQSYAAFEGRNVSRIELAARPGVDLDQLRALIQQQQGQPFSADALHASVAGLQHTGKFNQVQVSIQFATDGVRLLFILPPVYNIGLISFPGADKVLSYTQLLQAINTPLDSPFVQDHIPDQEKGLRDYFAKQGFFAGTVSTSLQTDDQHRIVNMTFHCELHSRAKLSGLTIEGISGQEAADAQKTLTSNWAKLTRLALRPGTTYSRDRIDKAIARLRAHFQKEGRLAPSIRANPTYEPGSNRVQLTLVIEPGPIVSVRIEGARLWKRTMRKLIPIYQENSVDQDLVDEGQRNLVSYFQSKSYFDVTVDSQLDAQPDHVNVIYRVNKGTRHRVANIRFEGNKYFRDDQLKSYIAVSQAKLLKRGTFSKDLLQKSADSISTVYRNEGFAKVAVTPVVVDHDPNPNIDITFRIDEGPQTRVHNWTTVDQNNQPMQLKIRANRIRLGPGKPYSERLLDADRDQIIGWYLNHGYPNAQFSSQVSAVDGDQDSVDVVYKIDEGRAVNVGEVVQLGVDNTRPKFVSSITQQSVKEGQPLSQSKLLQSESDLYNLGVFDWASVSPVGSSSDPSQQQVLVRVHESKRNSMDIGGGIEIIPRSGNIPVGAVVVPGIPPISLGNKFTVTQKSFVGPRGTFQFSRHNIRGRAETAALALIASRLDQRLAFTYADPYLHGSSWSSLFTLSTERTTENPIFTALLQQGSVQIERQLDRKRTKKIVAGYSYQSTDLSNIIIPELVLPQDQHVKLSSFYVQYLRDSRDNPLDAHHGIFQTFNFRISPAAIGSSSNIIRFFGQTSFYKPIKPWLTWANNFRVGLTAGYGAEDYVPLSERFFAGGPDSLRGFPINGAGPQRPVPVCSNPDDPSTCTLISVADGGLMLAIFNTEARFPIHLIDNLGGVIFYDGGNVYSNINARQFINNYSNSIGIGLRYKTKVGPIRLDIGRNLNPIPGVNATQYFVTLGQSF